MKEDKKKVEMGYEKIKKLNPEYLYKIRDTQKIETRYAIILAIINFGSLNIKKLAYLLDKNEATIYHHIQQLTKNPNLLIINQEFTQKYRGIYYSLADEVKDYFSEPPKEVMQKRVQATFEDLLKQSDQDIYDFILNSFSAHPDLGNFERRERTQLTYNHILEKIMITNIAEAEKALKAGLKPENKTYPLGTIESIPFDMKINKPRHMIEIMSLFAKTYIEFYKLKERIEEEIKLNDINEENTIDVHFHLVGGELTKFEFREEKK